VNIDQLFVHLKKLTATLSGGQVAGLVTMFVAVVGVGGVRSGEQNSSRPTAAAARRDIRDVPGPRPAPAGTERGRRQGACPR